MLPVDQRWAPMLGRAPNQAEGGSLVGSAGCAQGNSEKAPFCLQAQLLLGTGVISIFLIWLASASVFGCELRIL